MLRARSCCGERNATRSGWPPRDPRPRASAPWRAGSGRPRPRARARAAARSLARGGRAIEEARVRRGGAGSDACAGGARGAAPSPSPVAQRRGAPRATHAPRRTRGERALRGWRRAREPAACIERRGVVGEARGSALDREPRRGDARPLRRLEEGVARRGGPPSAGARDRRWSSAAAATRAGARARRLNRPRGRDARRQRHRLAASGRDVLLLRALVAVELVEQKARDALGRDHAEQRASRRARASWRLPRDGSISIAPASSVSRGVGGHRCARVAARPRPRDATVRATSSPPCAVRFGRRARRRAAARAARRDAVGAVAPTSEPAPLRSTRSPASPPPSCDDSCAPARSSSAGDEAPAACGGSSKRRGARGTRGVDERLADWPRPADGLRCSVPRAIVRIARLRFVESASTACAVGRRALAPVSSRARTCPTRDLARASSTRAQNVPVVRLARGDARRIRPPRAHRAIRRSPPMLNGRQNARSTHQDDRAPRASPARSASGAPPRRPRAPRRCEEAAIVGGSSRGEALHLRASRRPRAFSALAPSSLARRARIVVLARLVVAARGKLRPDLRARSATLASFSAAPKRRRARALAPRRRTARARARDERVHPAAFGSNGGS